MILAIDTIAPVAGVAALHDGRCAVRTERVARGTETRLPAWIREVLAELGGAPSDVSGVAVAVGPGAFTGLRVGLAAAAGFALARAVPMWATDGLHTRALAVGAGPVLALLDARKGRVYAASWRDGLLVRAPADLPLADALAGLPPGFAATGEGALLHREALGAAGGLVAADADDPAVATLARLGEAALAAGEGRDARAVRPLYLREPDAIPVAERRAGWT